MGRSQRTPGPGRGLGKTGPDARRRAAPSVVLVAAWVLVAGCDTAAITACDSRAEPVLDGAFRYCVYDEAQSGRPSFACPEDFPNRVDVGAQVVCTTDLGATAETLPPSVCELLTEPSCGHAPDAAVDAGVAGDASTRDASAADASTEDASTEDAGAPVDAGPDAGAPMDAGPRDAGPRPDMGPPGRSVFPMWPLPGTPGNPLSYDVRELTVVDRVTGLEWQRVIPAESYLHDDGLAYCDLLSLDGKLDWRLPTRIELLSIVDYTHVSPAIDPTAFPDTPSAYFWTSSAAVTPGNTPIVYFAFGSTNFSDERSHLHRVRCVR